MTISTRRTFLRSAGWLPLVATAGIPFATAYTDIAPIERIGVIVAVQNHGDFINTGEQHVSLLKRVNHKWCAALVDTGKYLTADPYSDIALTAPYAANWQIKKTLGSTMDSPRVDMKRLLTIIRKSG